MLHNRKLLGPAFIIVAFLFGSVCLNATIPKPAEPECQTIQAIEQGLEEEELCDCPSQ